MTCERTDQEPALTHRPSEEFAARRIAGNIEAQVRGKLASNVCTTCPTADGAGSTALSHSTFDARRDRVHFGRHRTGSIPA